jgi:hypothetical protein
VFVFVLFLSAASEEAEVKEALWDWEKLTCITFRPASRDDENRVVIQNGSAG